MYINVLLVKIGLGRELVNRIYHQLPVVLLGVLQTPLLINQPMGSFWSRGIWSFPILPSKQTWKWKMDEHNYAMSQNGLSHNMELKTYIITKSTKSLPWVCLSHFETNPHIRIFLAGQILMCHEKKKTFWPKPEKSLVIAPCISSHGWSPRPVGPKEIAQFAWAHGVFITPISLGFMAIISIAKRC